MNMNMNMNTLTNPINYMPMVESGHPFAGNEDGMNNNVNDLQNNMGAQLYNSNNAFDDTQVAHPTDLVASMPEQFNGNTEAYWQAQAAGKNDMMSMYNNYARTQGMEHFNMRNGNQMNNLRNMTQMNNMSNMNNMNNMNKMMPMNGMNNMNKMASMPSRGGPQIMLNKQAQQQNNLNAALKIKNGKISKTTKQSVRENRAANEARRRDRFNERIEELKALVCAETNTKMIDTSKITVIEKAIEIIKKNSTRNTSSADTLN